MYLRKVIYFTNLQPMIHIWNKILIFEEHEICYPVNKLTTVDVGSNH